MENNTTKYEIDEALVKYVAMVIERDKIDARLEGNTLITSIPEEDVDILVEDAECEEQREKINPDIPVYSARTFYNEEKFKRLQTLFYNKSNLSENECESFGFHLLERDYAKVLGLYEEEIPDEENLDPGMTWEKLGDKLDADIAE